MGIEAASMRSILDAVFEKGEAVDANHAAREGGVDPALCLVGLFVFVFYEVVFIGISRRWSLARLRLRADIGGRRSVFADDADVERRRDILRQLHGHLVIAEIL